MRHRVVLFDIDQTLIDGGGAGRRALEGAVKDVTGLGCDLHGIAFAGRTDPAIVRDLLASVGLDAAGGRIAAIFGRYVERLERELADRSRGRVLPGVREVLAALEARPLVHVGVLTGNIAAGARLKLRAFGLDRFAFGAYGDDAASRPALLPVALERWRRVRRERAGGAESECDVRDIFVVGDTVHDVTVAKAWGARSVAVGTGADLASREELLAAGPDLFLEDLTASDPLLDAIG